jgi:plasmid replication initiation protein
VIYQFSSKYALALYEAICRRVNLRLCVEEFTLAEFRDLLRVPDGKLERFPDLHRYAIKPALLEVNGLADFQVHLMPRKRGKKVVGIILSWGRKDQAGRGEAWAERERPRVGRKARLRGEIDELADGEALPRGVGKLAVG